jgi:hypothetical protein
MWNLSHHFAQNIRSSAPIRSHKSSMFMRVRAEERCERNISNGGAGSRIAGRNPLPAVILVNVYAVDSGIAGLRTIS